MSTPFMAQIEIFSFNFAPKGWAECNGQLLPINQNQALFSLLGTTFGGDGRVNFALPDFRSRVPISFGNNPLGSRGGQESHTLTQQEMAMHNHQLNADATSASQNTPGAGLGKTSGAITPTGVFNVSMYQTGNPNNVLAPQSVTNTGGSQPHENRMPFLVLNFCIALQGIFPSQN
ncbi:MAG: hypothetical protein QOG66_1283 [Methylobacteriaceae bacterium]|jgi:microcystin-dependent protein|nr:hypothetical protein [Methylobacteriaceae bacterium]